MLIPQLALAILVCDEKDEGHRRDPRTQRLRALEQIETRHRAQIQARNDDFRRITHHLTQSDLTIGDDGDRIGMLVEMLRDPLRALAVRLDTQNPFASGFRALHTTAPDGTALIFGS
jgi:hypothetical protein